VRAHPAGPLHAEQVHEHGLPAAPPDLNALDPAVWARGVARSESGWLTVGGAPVPELVATYGSPVFVLDEADFRGRCRAFAEAFSGGDVYYASKAFLAGAVAGWVEQEGLGLDVSSAGELTLALRAGFPPGRMVLHGNNKTTGELEAAVSAGVGRIVLDSFDEIRRLEELARASGRRPQVLVRVTVGVEAHTHEFIATAHEDQKFGFSLAGGTAAEAVRQVLAGDVLDLVGLHSHIGSQIFDTSGFEVAAHRVVGFAAEIRDRHRIELGELNLGGGLGIAYVRGDDPADVVEVAKSLHDIVARETAAVGLPVPQLAVEPGRAIVGPSMLTAYEVGTVKPVDTGGGLTRTYVSVDGGMSDNIRTALYDAEYTVVLGSRRSDAPPMLARVVGRHCETGDVVVKDAWLPSDVAPGDLLAVAATGAYCRAMASAYNYVPRPAVVAVGGPSAGPEAARVILRRESVHDLFALDPVLAEAGASIGSALR
jgi:diaminopimelate decarboxylase